MDGRTRASAHHGPYLGSVTLRSTPEEPWDTNRPGPARPDRPRRHSGLPVPPISRAEISTCMPTHATRPLGRRSAAPWAVAAAQCAPRTHPTRVNAPPPLAAVACVCSELHAAAASRPATAAAAWQRSAAAARWALQRPVHLWDVVSKFVWVRRDMGPWLVQCVVSVTVVVVRVSR